MKTCHECNSVEGTPHGLGCSLTPKSGPVIAMDVMEAIGDLLPDAELAAYAPGKERWLAIQNHVAEIVREHSRLRKRNDQLEERLQNVIIAAKGFTVDDGLGDAKETLRVWLNSDRPAMDVEELEAMNEVLGLKSMETTDDVG